MARVLARHRRASTVELRLRAAGRLGQAALTGSLVLTIGSSVALVLTGLATAFVGHTNGASEVGSIATVLGIVAIVSDLTDFGTGTFVSREVAAGLVRMGEAVATLRIRMVFPAAIGMLACVLAAVGSFGKYDPLALSAAAYLVSFAWNLSLNSLCRAAGLYRWAAAATALDRLFLLSAVAWRCAAGGCSAVFFVMALAGGSFIAACSMHVGLKVSPWRSSDRTSLLNLYKAASRLGVSGLATDLSILETPFVAALAGGIQAGYYGAASRLASPIAIPGASSSAVILRRGSPDAGKRAPRILREQMPIVGLCGGAAVIAALLAAPLMHTVFGPTFGQPAIVTFRLVCVTVVIGVMAQLLYTTLVAMRLERKAAISQWVTVPLGLTFTAIGAWIGGAALAVTGGMCAQTAQVIWMMSHIISARRGAR